MTEKHCSFEKMFPESNETEKSIFVHRTKNAIGNPIPWHSLVFAKNSRLFLFVSEVESMSTSSIMSEISMCLEKLVSNPNQTVYV